MSMSSCKRLQEIVKANYSGLKNDNFDIFLKSDVIIVTSADN